MFKCILADPPWQLSLRGKRHRKKEGQFLASLPYPTMTVENVCKLKVQDFADDDCHLWLWTTNQHLPNGFEVMKTWGFKYLMPIHWIKPSGIGNWFIHRTQTVLFGYNKKCKFPLERYKPNVVFTGVPKRHSEKPVEFYDLIERISPGPRLELFARTKRTGWSCWGNEVECDISL